MMVCKNLETNLLIEIVILQIEDQLQIIVDHMRKQQQQFLLKTNRLHILQMKNFKSIKTVNDL